VAWFDGFITDETIDRVRQLLQNPDMARSWAEENYQLARRYFSYTVLEHRLQSLVEDCLGYRE
jgi:hypothetical protein